MRSPGPAQASFLDDASLARDGELVHSLLANATDKREPYGKVRFLLLLHNDRCPYDLPMARGEVRALFLGIRDPDSQPRAFRLGHLDRRSPGQNSVCPRPPRAAVVPGVDFANNAEFYVASPTRSSAKPQLIDRVLNPLVVRHLEYSDDLLCVQPT